ncbi:MAG: S46 family peptidase [Bacteroidetes bacterium]|nr:S46 family peptidase [Bacteroidota bacterium]
MNFLKKITLTFLLGFVYLSSFAGEGMWIPMLLKAMQGDMQAMGLKMTPEQIYSVNQGSLKDAIVHFNGGCTGEIISPNGLLLTNHHCGRGQIQRHTTLENNYLQDGFWAKDYGAELPNSGLFVTFLSRMEDVTTAALAGVKDNMDPRVRQSVIDKNLNLIKENAKLAAYEKAEIRPFFKGNQYYMLISVTYNDVRLVGAPPSSIGEFGKDTDNWVWPRHSGDFSLFRVYAGKDNLPAEYSEDNVPFSPKHYLPVSLDGVEQGDFTLVFGYPGRTNEYLPSPAVEQIMNVIDPARIAVRDRTLNVLNAEMRADPEVKIIYTSRQAGIANAWKKWQGEVLGLKRTNAVAKKQKTEQKFLQLVQGNQTHMAKYGSILNDFRRLYTEIYPYAEANAYYSEATRVNIELLRAASVLSRLVNAYENEGETGYEAFKPRVIGYLKGFYKNYRANIDQKVFASVMELFADKVHQSFLPTEFTSMVATMGGDFSKLAEEIYDQSLLTNGEEMMRILELPASDVIKALTNDNAYQMSSALAEAYAKKVSEKYNSINEEITALQRTYMKALMEVFPKKKFYPDANSTLRVSYGKVAGYNPRDAIKYEPVTYVEGIMEKYVPEDYEYDIPAKLLDLIEKKDYGQYGYNGKMPVNFIGSNHTSGGNSGSPVIDAHGNLIGLNFDRVWEGTMSDINYDPSICRNIMVDIRYVLWITDKLGGATHLIEEMSLVRPKRDGKTDEVRYKKKVEPAPKFKTKQRGDVIKKNEKNVKTKN